VSRALQRKEQVYVVCPVIEESETSDVQAAEAVAEELEARYRDYRVDLLHGRLKDEEKERIVTAFLEGAVDLLVTTTVIEVGVDVPNATIMMVDGADRFGLAQLHQLRGRVGRSHLRSQCHLVADPKNPIAVERLEALAQTDDGFELAEADLSIRGPGELYGRRQAGLPGFRYGHLLRDAGMLTDARADVHDLLAADPDMTGPAMMALKEELQRRLMADDAPVGEEAG
jgi:ATP-dependent DNA helicase RecG